LVVALAQSTDNEAKLIGAVKFTNINGTNRYYLSRAMEQLKHASQGDWILVQAFDKHPNYECLHNVHAAAQCRQGSSRSRSPFIPPLDLIAHNSGFIEDSKVVVFYSNDLLETPPEPILASSDDRAINYVHGLATIYVGLVVKSSTDLIFWYQLLQLRTISS
jgi:hypothetical protein